MQFSDVPGSGFEGYVCMQFPDPNKPLDKLIVSLIMVAVALPTRLIIGRLFQISNQPVGLREGLWLRNLGLAKLATGAVSWRAPPAAAASSPLHPPSSLAAAPQPARAASVLRATGCHSDPCTCTWHLLMHAHRAASARRNYADGKTKTWQVRAERWWLLQEISA